MNTDNDLNLNSELNSLDDYISQNGSKFAVRADLREHAFRKYEQYIADACVKGTFTITPMLPSKSGELKQVKPDTFVTRFSDAKLAFKRYGYSSNIIPANFDLSLIKAKALENGKVIIINFKKESENMQAAKMLRVGDDSQRAELIAEIAATDTYNQRTDITEPKILYVTCVSDAEYALLEELTAKTNCVVKRHTNTIARIW